MSSLNDQSKLFTTLAEYNPHLLMMDINQKSPACKDLLQILSCAVSGKKPAAI